MVDYLRISVTDRCNLRCNYCMPRGGILNKPHNELLTFEEITRATKIFASLGIKKVRLTGGEPLVREEIVSLVGSIAKLQGIEEITLTTNGTLLPLYAESLKRAGLKRLNVSLDTLDRAKFKALTGNDSLERVLRGIEKAKEAGFSPIKLNIVAMRGVNDDELSEFVNFAFFNGLIPRFIEFMKITPLWKERYFMPIEEVKETIQRQFGLFYRVGVVGSGPAEYYKTEDGNLAGFIKTSKHTCANCRRLRLTSTGELKICLYEDSAVSIKEILRGGSDDSEIRSIIARKMGLKEDADFSKYESTRLYMCSIGG